MDTEELARVTESGAAAGATVAADAFRTDLDVSYKSGKTDVVTQADKEAQTAVAEEIRAAVPDATIYGEEGEDDQQLPTEGPVWIVDPVDGTNNFVRGNRRWTTSVACLLDGEPVAAVSVLPALDDRYVGTPDGVALNGTELQVSDRTDPERFAVAPIVWWDRDRRDEYAAATTGIVERFGDIRRPGSAQATLSLVAAGTLDGAFTNRETNAWDTVAGAAMVEWAGGTVTDLDGNRWHHDERGLVASNGQAHEEVLAAAREAEAVAGSE
jgi:myo-inositol-1(or 4)-monophosphatase